MKLSCLQENFNKGISAVSHIATGNVTLPILNNILLEAKKEGLLLTSTNLEIGIRSNIRVKMKREGTFTIPAQILNNFVNSLPNKPINIEVTDNILYLECENYKTKIKGTSTEEFPLFPQIERKNGYSCKIKNFKKAVQQVISSVATDEYKPEISGVLFNSNLSESHKLTLAGTDSYRLSEKTLEINNLPSNKNENDNQEIIVPAKTLHELLRILTEPEENIEIYVSENQILFTWDDSELISRTISGKYPDYRQIIPQEHKTKAIIDLNNFIRIIKSAGLFSQSGLNDIYLELKPSENKIIIKATNNQIGENVSEIEADIEGEENKIVFNYRYLLDGLANIDTSEVILEMTDHNTPAVLKPSKDGNYLYIIMPIRQ